MQTSVLFLCLLVCGQARRFSASIAEGEEPHHVCVTGNQAAQAVDSFMLQGTGEARRDLSLTSLISTESCTVQEALVGSTLVTINADQNDQCAARWKANSLTCDVFFHAHSGPDAEEIYKTRLMAENFDCNAAMIIVHDSPDMRTNFNSKMNKHATRFPGHGCAQSPIWINSKSESTGAYVAK